MKFFARADQLDGKTWDSKEAVQNHLAPEAHKTHFVETVCYYLSSLHDIYKLWQLKVIDAGVVDAFGDKTVQLYPLSPQQTAIFSALVAAVRTRADDNSETQRTSILNPMSHNAEIRGRPSQHHIIQDTSEDEAGPPVPPQQEDWRTLRVILGKPGTGKSQVIIRVVHECFTNDFSCLVVTPVALLANHYRDLFGRRITSNTLHSVFRIPVGEAQQHAINFSLGSFDIMVIDEASMVSRATFDHIGTTLSALKKRPVVLIAGDKVQQQPLGNHHGRVVQLASILNDGTLTGNCVIYKLYRQFRCVDAAYSTFLDHIRYWQPTQEFLDRIQHGRIISATDQVTDLELWENIKQEPTATILTVSREATDRVNSIVLQNLFHDADPITDVPCKGRFHTFPVFSGMRVMLTENRDKESEFVNGQRAVVISNRRNTVLLGLPNGDTLFTHPISSLDDDGTRQVAYAFTPGYGVTICKSQGATLSKVFLWLDSPQVPLGTAYVGLSRVRRLDDIRFVTRMIYTQVQPVAIQDI